MPKPRPANNDLAEATVALEAWFRSQSISPAAAAIICARMIAALVAAAATDLADLDIGLSLMIENLKATARDFLKQKESL